MSGVRVKTWTTGEDVTAADINAEFDNTLASDDPAFINDYSATVGEMQTQTDPGEQGSESQATLLKGELERLRFILKEITGKTYWYESPASSIAELTSALGGGLPNNRVISGKTNSANSSQPLFLDPAISTNTITLLGASTSFVYTIEGIQYTISSDVTATGLTSAATSNNTALVDNSAYADEKITKHAGEYDSDLIYDTAGSSITALDGEIVAFKVAGVGTEYFIGRLDNGSTRIVNCNRGYFFDGSQAEIARTGITNNDTITLMKLTWVFANTALGLEVTFNNPVVSADEPASPSIGDYWFDTVNDKWQVRASGSWGDANATLIGVCIQDENGNTVGARGFDFFVDNNEANTVELEFVSVTQIRAKRRDHLVKVYGSTVRFPHHRPIWDITVDLESGVSEAASTIFYAYLTETGDRKLSDIAPYDRRGDLRGFYHPYETWRYIGCITNDGSSDFDTATLRSAPENQARVITTHTTTGTWTLYPGVQALDVSVWGGGGGGGGAVGTTGESSAGGSGGGGSYARSLLKSNFAVSLPTTIGAAGAAGADTGGNGGTGGTSVFGDISCVGGAFGNGDPVSTTAGTITGGGTGGAATGGNVQNLRGVSGSFGLAIDTEPLSYCFGGGLGGGGGGDGGTGRSGNAAGTTGVEPGGGGSGGVMSNNATGQAGGTGAVGRVIVEEVYG